VQTNQNEANTKASTLCDLLKQFISLLLRGDVPQDVIPLLRDNHLLALPKIKANSGIYDVRPIGMGNVYRKMASKVILKWALQYCESSNYFDNLQYAFVPSGAAHIVHVVQLYFEMNPSWDFLCLDAAKAFQQVSRLKGLLLVKQKCPKLFPFMDLMYSNDSFGWFMDKDGVHAFKSCEGYHQGDVLGSWAFCFTIQPLLDSLKQYIVEKYGPTLLFLIAFYVDDGEPWRVPRRLFSTCLLF